MSNVNDYILFALLTPIAIVATIMLVSYVKENWL